LKLISITYLLIYFLKNVINKNMNTFIQYIESQQNVTRYVHLNGMGILNNAALDYSKLSDSQYESVEEEMLGMQQPPSFLHGKSAIFAFTPEGEQKHKKLIKLLSKASKTKVIKKILKINQYDIVWTSVDGQVALIPKLI